MSRARGRNRKYRVLAAGLAGAAVIAGGVATTGAFAGEEKQQAAGQDSAAQTIVCPSTDGKLPEVPEKAREEVERNLALLDKQLAEANARLVSSQGEGGPNFVQNAILGPLEDKRTAALNRIETAIGRVAAKPEGLEALAPCSLSDEAQGGDGADGAPGGEGADGADGAPGGEGAEGGQGAEDGQGGDVAQNGVPTVDCPDVASQLPADVPVKAQSQVDRELALLDKQITEANARLVSSQGEGGPNFVQNAILGPLEGKRRAVIDRIGIAINREGGTRPTGLEALAVCGLNE